MNSTSTVERQTDLALPGTVRAVVYRTRGRQQGPIVRLVSPSDVGELIKPFVFLDHFNVPASNAPGFGFHPHSGIATLTLMFEGGFSYEDSTGATGTMRDRSVEWMRAGVGVWHKGTPVGERIMGYQLWVALGPDLETGPAESQYLEPNDFQTHGPARVILGELGDAKSPIRSPSSMNYLDVHLRAGEVWRYDPPAGHDVLWVAVHKGELLAPKPIPMGELAVFAQGESAVTFVANADTSFVLGSAKKHPHPLVLGNYSVHTTPQSLQEGEAEIFRIAARLRSAGKL